MRVESGDNKENKQTIGDHHLTPSATAFPQTERKMGAVSLPAIAHTSHAPLASTIPAVSNAAAESEEATVDSLFTLSTELDSLTDAQKVALKNRCMTAYAESLPVFEKALAEVAAKHPDSKEFSGEMCRRLFAVTKALQEIQLEGKEPGWLKELQIKLNVAAEFAQDQTAAGSVGFNPLAIEQAVKEGTLREQMTMIYATLWTALPKVLQDPELVKQVNEKLQGDFALDSASIERRRAVDAKDFFPMAPELIKFREAGGRIKNPNPPEKKPQLSEVSDITIREARATLQDYISQEEFASLQKGGHLSKRHVEWVRGKDLYALNKESDFYKKAIEMGKLPVVTGPSGTTDGYMLGCTYLGMESYKEAAVLALIGWMVRSGDHSLHEIREAANWHGVSYTTGPEGFETIYPDDFAILNDVGDELEKEGFHLPKYYLSPAYQKEVVQKERHLFGSGENNLHF